METKEVRVQNDHTVIIKNDNTTIGYACFNPSDKTLDYIYVNPLFRRQGVASKLLSVAENSSGCVLEPVKPLSPLGQKFFKSKYRLTTSMTLSDQHHN